MTVKCARGAITVEELVRSYGSWAADVFHKIYVAPTPHYHSLGWLYGSLINVCTTFPHYHTIPQIYLEPMYSDKKRHHLKPHYLGSKNSECIVLILCHIIILARFKILKNLSQFRCLLSPCCLVGLVGLGERRVGRRKGEWRHSFAKFLHETLLA